MPIMDKIKQRFYQYCDKKENGCWEWSGALTVNGYGKFWMDGKTTSAHRVSFELHKHAIPSSEMVLHTCDNPKCVNPDHLTVGTHRDNVRHMQERGRFLTGEENSASKITAEKAKEIIQRLLNGAKVRTLAKQMNVSRGIVKGIANKVTWKHVWKEFEAA